MKTSGSIFLKAAAFSVLTLLTWPAALHAAPSLSVGVSDMAATDWQQVVVLHAGPATVTQAVSTTITPANTFWLNTFQVPRTTSAFSSDDRVANIYTPQFWLPSVQGAIDYLDFTIDVRGLSSFSNGYTGSIRPVIRQGGIVFSSISTDVTVLVGPSFSPLTWHLEDTNTWVDVNQIAVPNFSALGTAIEFGYRYTVQAICSSASGCSPARADLGIDNFQVNVFAIPTAVPEPGSLALVLCGLLVLPVARRWSARR